MKTIIVLLCVCFSVSAQEPWELPIKNDLVTFEFQKEFKNKQKALKDYFKDAAFYTELLQKINSELSNKGTKLLSNTQYLMTHTMPDGTQLSAKEPGKYKDTVNFELTITSLTTNNTKMQIVGKKTKFYRITGKTRLIFKDKNKYEMRVRGFNISDITPNTKSQDVFIEDIYKPFIQEEKKSKADKAFYQDIKELVNLFESLFARQFERNIQVTETD